MRQNSKVASTHATQRHHSNPHAPVKGLEIPTCYENGYRKARPLNPSVADEYIRHTTCGDPLADRVAEDLREFAGTGRDHEVIALALHNHRNIPKEVPESIRELVGQCSVIPDWWEPEVAKIAIRAFHRNSDIIVPGLAVGAIPGGFTTLIAKSFRIRSRLIMNGVRRLKQNLLQLVEQFLPGGNEPGGDAWKLSLRIRIVHAISRQLILESDEWDTTVYGTPLSAAHMNQGAAGFSGALMIYVALLGGDFTDEERDAYTHVWRYTGVTMGIPESFILTDQASALEIARIGAECEPPPDVDSIIMANSLINSIPLVLGVRDPEIRRRDARRYYRICRELIGDEKADQLRFPPKHRIKIVPFIHVKTKLRRLLIHLPFPSDRRLAFFNYLLDISDLGRLDHSYHLPSALLDENSRDW